MLDPSIAEQCNTVFVQNNKPEQSDKRQASIVDVVMWFSHSSILAARAQSKSKTSAMIPYDNETSFFPTSYSASTGLGTRLGLTIRAMTTQLLRESLEAYEGEREVCWRRFRGHSSPVVARTPRQRRRRRRRRRRKRRRRRRMDMKKTDFLGLVFSTLLQVNGT